MADPTLRPDVPLTHPDEAEHRRQIAVRSNASLAKDGTNAMTKPLQLEQYTVSGLTADALDASLWTGALVYVTDETGGAVPAFSDGTNWRRVTDRAIVS